MSEKELELLEYVFSLAIGEAYSEEINEIANLQRKIICTLKENQELKKQIEEKENQQKEFIEYLKNKEKEFDMMGAPINSGACLGILREYKEIIRGKEC